MAALPESYERLWDSSPGSHILVVDGDAAARTLYCDTFAAAGCDVVQASDGHEALMKSLSHPPMLIIAELNLPVMDGVSLCHTLRHDDVTSGVPVLIVTSEHREAELARAQRAGANAVLKKPASAEAILRESRKLLGQAATLREKSEALHDKIANQLRVSATLCERSERQRLALATASRVVQTPGNRLLAALPLDDLNRLSRDFRVVPVKPKQVFHRHGERIEYVVFPNGGVYSVLSVLSSGTMVEAATIGDEGMIGVEAFLTDDPIAVADTVLQVPDTDAITLPVPVLRRELARRGALYHLLGRYSKALIAQIIQLNACNATHPLRQRCARWLLMTGDRVHADDFHLSHEFLAIILGVQRPTMTEVAGSLQRDGLIQYRHGRMRVLDREGLEAASCECYSIVRKHLDPLRSLK